MSMPKAEEECAEKQKNSCTPQCTGEEGCPPLSTPAWGPWFSCRQSSGSQPVLCCREGTLGKFAGGQWQCHPRPSHPTAGTGSLQPCQHMARARGSLPAFLPGFAQQSLCCRTHVLPLLLVHYISLPGLRCSC